MADFFLNAGDTASPIFETLEDETGAAVDIQGATVKITVTPIHGGTPIINDKAALNLQVGDGSDGTKGQVSYGEGSAPYAAGETTTAGDYLYLWKVTYAGGQIQTFPNDGYRLLTITRDAPTAEQFYISRDELKKTLNLSNESYADADLDVALESATRGLEEAYSTRWRLSAAAQTRYYTAYTDREVLLGDVISITSVTVDMTSYPGSGTYATTLTSPTDYRVYPLEAGLAGAGGNGEPYRTLRLARGASILALPCGEDAVKVVGQFGWERVPAGVRAATAIIATRILRRARDNPTGFAALGVDGEVMRAVGFMSDPEIRFAMQGLAPSTGRVWT